MTEIWQMSLSEQSAAVAKGALSPSEIVETAISRIEELDCKTNACVTLIAEAAMVISVDRFQRFNLLNALPGEDWYRLLLCFVPILGKVHGGRYD